MFKLVKSNFKEIFLTNLITKYRKLMARLCLKTHHCRKSYSIQVYNV